MGTVYSRLAQKQYVWKTEGTITAAGSALGTDKSATTVTDLTSTTRVIYTPDSDNTVAIDVRFKGDATDADSNVVNMYAMRGDNDDYTLVGTLTLTTGTQTDGTNLYVDTITIASEKWIDAIEVISDAGNGMAHVALNTHGFRNFCFIATTLNSTSLIIDIARM